MTNGPLILGATGQIGTAFRKGASDLFESEPIWQARRPLDGHLHWDILNQPAPDLLCSGILSFAGSNRETAEVQIALAKAACDLGERLDVPVLLASSQAVYAPEAGPLKEDRKCQPATEYGRVKLEMEYSVAGRPGVTCLRIGNVPGCDMLFSAVRAGRVCLDQWLDGEGPHRSMIGLRSLADVCSKLLRQENLPAILNVAQPGLVAMQDLLEAAKADWQWQPAPKTAVRELELDVTLLCQLIDLRKADAVQMVKEGQACGAIL